MKKKLCIFPRDKKIDRIAKISIFFGIVFFVAMLVIEGAPSFLSFLKDLALSILFIIFLFFDLAFLLTKSNKFKDKETLDSTN